jgi:hypothetical protein
MFPHSCHLEDGLRNICSGCHVFNNGGSYSPLPTMLRGSSICFSMKISVDTLTDVGYLLQ